MWSPKKETEYSMQEYPWANTCQRKGKRARLPKRERSSCNVHPMTVLANALQKCSELGKKVRPLYPCMDYPWV